MSLLKRHPLRVQFVVTSMPVGGAEVLLVNLIRRLDRERFAPELICLKQRGPLGDELAQEIPVYCELTRGKYDPRVVVRLTRLMRQRAVDAVVTVAAGDNMFWGRLAARAAGVPVVASAIHSTGWPDGIGRLNRMLTPLTDAFIAVADAHARHLVEVECFPASKVHTIYNGVDVDRFVPRPAGDVRAKLGLAVTAPVVGIVAALRPEKNHELFLVGAERLLREHPAARFLIVGDGPRRSALEQQASDLGIRRAVQFLGVRSDVPELLAAMDLVALTSHNEASPVSILEALSSGRPVVAANVGSVAETVVPDQTGLLFPAGDAKAYAAAAGELLADRPRRERLGAEGRRRVVDRWSLDAMTRGYEKLVEEARAAATPCREAWPETPIVGQAASSG